MKCKVAGRDNAPQWRGLLIFRGFILLMIGLLVDGCAALAPVSSLVSIPHGDAPPLQMHDETRVDLAKDNFVLVKADVRGESEGFSLLGLITIYPATLTTAMKRMYASAQMRPGQSQTVAHLIIEQSSSFYILFGIPKVEVRADIVEFSPEAEPRQTAKGQQTASKPHGSHRP